MKLLIWLICCWPAIISAQEQNKGIRWIEGLTWQQVTTKAREENKFIFIDCYATWCGPCKAMDKQVFPLDSVGKYMNERFISVKVQMDISRNDKEDVVAWRKDAEIIRNGFKVDAFPCFLFLTSAGELVYKMIGYHSPGNFLANARMALKPGQVYIDPNEYNNSIMEDYLKGKYPPDSAFALYEYFRQTHDYVKVHTIEGDLYKFLTHQPFASLFRADRLKFIASITSRATDKWFPLFYRHAKKVNQIMNNNNYSERLVGGIILNSLVTPFLKMEMSGRIMANLETTGKINKKEADWNSLRKEIQKQFNRYYTERSILATQFTWYQLHQNIPSFVETYLKFLDRYGIDSHEWASVMHINNFCYNVLFLQVDNKRNLQMAIKWMKKVIDKQPSYNYLDTYASLLYKIGNKEEALRWEKIALEKARESENSLADAAFFELVIAKMEKGEKLNWQN